MGYIAWVYEALKVPPHIFFFFLFFFFFFTSNLSTLNIFSHTKFLILFSDWENFQQHQIFCTIFLIWKIFSDLRLGKFFPTASNRWKLKKLQHYITLCHFVCLHSHSISYDSRNVLSSFDKDEHQIRCDRQALTKIVVRQKLSPI